MREFRQSFSGAEQRMDSDKPWLDFDTSILFPPSTEQEEEKRPILTLHPYKANTRYDWDPVLQKKIKVGKDTWRGPFHNLKALTIPTNWAKHPLDAGPRETLEQIEATGLRYRFTERANGIAVGSWQPANRGGNLDLMKVFTKDYWDFKGRKRRAKTLQLLKDYLSQPTDTLRQTKIRN